MATARLTPVAGAAAHGIRPGGAVLVQPEGFVAWRSAGATTDTAAELGDALSAALTRSRT